MADETVLAKLKSFIGYETEFTDSQPIEEGMIRRFAEAIGDGNPLYHDRDFAHKSPYKGITAPPTFVFEWNHHEALWADEKGTYIADYALPPRLVRAGNEYEFIQSLRPGDIITTRSKIADVYEKQRASGEIMIFVVSESTCTNQRGERLGVQQGTFIVLL